LPITSIGMETILLKAAYIAIVDSTTILIKSMQFVDVGGLASDALTATVGIPGAPITGTVLNDVYYILRKYNSSKIEDMETVSKYTIISIVFVAIICILINGNTEVVAEGSKWVSKGDALNRMGNFSQAITAYDTALKIDPKDKQAWVSKGDALNRMGNFSQAITAYDTALKIDPNYVNALDGKGWSLNELGKYTQAIIYLDKALKIDPNHLDGLVFKAQALYNIGNYTGAKYYSDKAFDIDPKSPALKRLPEVFRKAQ